MAGLTNLQRYRQLVVASRRDPQFSPDANTLLLLHMDGTNGSTTFTDSSGNAHTVIVIGDAQVSTAQKKSGTGSLLCDGTGDSLRVNDTAGLEFSGNWTIECQIRADDDNSTSGGIFGRGLAANGNAVYQFRKNNAGSFNWAVSSNGSSWNIALRTAVGSYAALTWTKVALVFNGTNYRVLIDDVVVDTVASSTPVYAVGNGNHVIGTDNLAYFTGYIDEFRISDTARY
jgi:hypothetical protein